MYKYLCWAHLHQDLLSHVKEHHVCPLQQPVRIEHGHPCGRQEARAMEVTWRHRAYKTMRRQHGGRYMYSHHSNASWCKGTTHERTLKHAGLQYRVLHAPLFVLPYHGRTRQRTPTWHRFAGQIGAHDAVRTTRDAGPLANTGNQAMRSPSPARGPDSSYLHTSS